MTEEGTGRDKEFYMISHLINPKKKTRHYVPILLGNANIRLGKAKYRTLRILLDSGASSSIVLGKKTQKLRHKNTLPVKWRTQFGDFLTIYKPNVELVLSELGTTKNVMWSFHVDDSWKKLKV